MWRALMSSRFASWVVGKVSLPKERQLQHELDLQRLYILTHLARAGAAGKQVNLQALMLKSQSLEPPVIRAEVEAALTAQVVAVAEALHQELKQAGDPALAAEGMAAAAAEIQRRKARDASGFSKLIKGLRGDNKAGGGSGSGSGSSGGGSSRGAPVACGAEGTGAAGPGPSSSGNSGGSGGSWRVMSQSALAAALQRRGGFSLSLRPSSVPHPEAGVGVFLEGEARAGTVVAVFPGVLYGRTQLAHMPNFPKVDTDNPYLSCRYDQSIVDSKPWGRGDPGGSSSSSSSGSGRSSSSENWQATAAPAAATAGGGGTWWGWAGPLSAALTYLEGRHPLALGHYVNHPGQGQSPNVLEAPLDIPLDHPLLASRPWLRAYLPCLQPPLHYDPFNKAAGNDADEGDDEEDEDDEEEDDRAKRAAVAAGGDGGSGAVPERPRAPGELRRRQLLEPPGGVVRLLVLVATRGLKDGEELLQNYRMNPHVRRPDWYVVHDAEAEERRWAKIRALDLGFKGGKTAAAAGAAGSTGSGGSGSQGSGPASPAG
ncbi:hypothetical protein CHLRE_02g086076v5 [Chlamydomonas reinhardtii]|uniref:SET domain-containing protein n=1 Tax=Chlamydomonas reinhardtii TaxID=3055 RepID=A0A2K3E0Z1_CHLRE|nr:uncharacterized protein CHLRE_02g086076v5 [Chlamydomonas reinhardtii]PNW86427.1 hypothetical protein CHLRE_02g086076v5 [Chlamydomonas reinhardtii]